MNIRIAICGYGNLGRGVELAARNAPDTEPVAVITRRPPEAVQPLTSLPVFPFSDIDRLRDRVDVLILCGGSATDLPHQTPALADRFNTVDSFDTHAAIPSHFETVNRIASASGHLSLIGAGWDPGLFSLARVLFDAFLPAGSTATFWGRGVSQGHSDALRHIPGVSDAREYTVPLPGAMEAAESGTMQENLPTATHRRECYIVPEDNADREAILRAVRDLPDYFRGYETSVTFVTREELARDHAGLPHGGRVVRSGTTGGTNRHLLRLEARLDSNPEFTGSVLVACARAVRRMRLRGRTGCLTLPDIAPADLSPLPPEEIRKRWV